jgi:hypothetical protein
MSRSIITRAGKSYVKQAKPCLLGHQSQLKAILASYTAQYVANPEFIHFGETQVFAPTGVRPATRKDGTPP